MKLTITALLVSALMGTAAFAQATSETEKKSMEEYVKLLRQDVRANRNAVVDEAMALEPADKAKFWTIYDKYDKEMRTVWDQRLGGIKKYAETYDKMTDQTADELANGVFSNETQASALRKKYYGQVKDALGAKTAARFVQVESVLDRIVTLQLLANLPLIQ